MGSPSSGELSKQRAGIAAFQSGDANKSPGQATPGWYAVDPTNQQYWDGNQWAGSPQAGQPIQSPPVGQWAQKPLINGTTSDERTMAMFTHLMYFVVGGIGPLVMYFVKKDESQFIRHHAAEALNLFITTLIVAVGTFAIGSILFALGTVSDVLLSVGFALFLVAYFVIFAFIIEGAVLSVVAAIKANKGEPYRIPLVAHRV